MKAKGGRALVVLRGLILGSVLLLVLFLGYWLRTRYASEREVLQKDLAVKLEASQQELSDSLVRDRFFAAPTVNGSVEKKEHRGLKPDEHFTFRINLKASDSLPLPREVNKHIKVQGVAQDVSIVSNTERPDTMVIRTLGSMVQKTGIFGDSLKIILGVGDTVQLASIFQRKLKSGGYDFKVYLNELQMKKAGASGAPLAIKHRVSKQFLVAGYQPYLFRRILPDTLFAILLLCITSGAFWLTLRTLRQQMRLSLIRNELVSNMSHELKTPVATVKVALEALAEPEVAEDRNTVRDYVTMASLEVTRLEMLINQTLHTSLLEQGKLTMQRHPTDMRVLITELQQTMALRFRQQDAALDVQFEGADFTAAVDKLHMQGVLLNVLDNALRYGGQGVTVDVGVADAGQQLRITISDSGPGIPEVYLKQVFDKFFRVPTHNLHNIKGYGLGLSYACQVLEQHGGSISVKNNDGAGCTFFITIPKSGGHAA